MLILSIKTAFHRLVTITFIENPNNKSYVNHINCDKQDNRVENYETRTFQGTKFIIKNYRWLMLTTLGKVKIFEIRTIRNEVPIY